MVDTYTRFEDVLKKQGLNLTETRKLVFRTLQGKEPQTMAELIEACWRQIDRASVYRTITLFERLGIVKRLQIGWKYRLELSDDFQHHHHHLTCQICGRTTALPEDNELEKRLSQLAAKQGFAMRDHQLEIQGICQKCR
jgi:Fur family transcriptional regulator, ferric uptake regulator